MSSSSSESESPSKLQKVEGGRIPRGDGKQEKDPLRGDGKQEKELAQEPLEKAPCFWDLAKQTKEIDFTVEPTDPIFRDLLITSRDGKLFYFAKFLLNGSDYQILKARVLEDPDYKAGRTVRINVDAVARDVSWMLNIMARLPFERDYVINSWDFITGMTLLAHQYGSDKTVEKVFAMIAMRPLPWPILRLETLCGQLAARPSDYRFRLLSCFLARLDASKHTYSERETPSKEFWKDVELIEVKADNVEHIIWWVLPYCDVTDQYLKSLIDMVKSRRHRSSQELLWLEYHRGRYVAPPNRDGSMIGVLTGLKDRVTGSVARFLVLYALEMFTNP